PKQIKIDFFAKSGSYPYTKSKNNKLTKALVKFLIQDAQPISLAVSPNFREFIKELDPIFSLPNKKCLDCSMEYSDELDYVNFETTDLVFDDNIEFVDAQKEDEGGPKDRKIKINAPIDVTNMQYKIKNALYNALLHYWNLSDNELFLACLLDPRLKKLRFATLTQQLQAKAALREKYNNIKSFHQSSLTPINQSLDVCEEQPLAENSRRQIYQKMFIKPIFTQNTINKPNDKLVITFLCLKFLTIIILVTGRMLKNLLFCS
ncbi:44766_t:CDS:2, partial [Gigaspora margarita]